MERNQKRWGLTMEIWNERVEFLKKYTRERNAYMKKYAKTFFNLSNEEYRKYFGDI